MRRQSIEILRWIGAFVFLLPGLNIFAVNLLAWWQNRRGERQSSWYPPISGAFLLIATLVSPVPNPWLCVALMLLVIFAEFVLTFSLRAMRRKNYP